MPELPEAMKARFEAKYGLSTYDAATLTGSRLMASYYEKTVEILGGEAKLVANWVMGEIASYMNRNSEIFSLPPISPAQLARLLSRILDSTISGKIAKEVFARMCKQVGLGVVILRNLNEEWRDDFHPKFDENLADQIIEEKGLKQESDSGAIEAIIDEVLAANVAMVEEFKTGKEKAFNALVGQAMKASKGKANPAQVNEILKKKLGN